MVQGTGSHVGKTLLVAGLCRLFRDSGLRVAPFKAQNMSLNAFVTREGGEIGWAQAIQAEAAGAEPSVDMNPILLKPQTGGSQVIVHGRVWGTLSPRAYYERRPELWAEVVAAYRRLGYAFDVVVIEGAGSPAEPNLMTADIANMAVARLARAPVVLVGDIDRGGVFASLVGSLGLLPRMDRRRVRGFLINRFRGDRALLAPAIEFLTARTRRPVLGVVPYLPDLHLPEEDSVALEAEPAGSSATTRSPASVAVVRLPHIANFTDFAPLAADPSVCLRYVSRPEELGGAALVILPGSKDTLADLAWLHASGVAAALSAHLARGGQLGGVCGGFQMLGHVVEDPEGLERGGRVPGLGWLPVRTVLAPRKITRRVRARLGRNGALFDAYEIHLGRTETLERVAPFAWIDAPDGTRPDGAVSADGRVWGTYLHGLFDAPRIRAVLVGGLHPAAAAETPTESYRDLRERGYARLAAALVEHVDLAAIRALVRLS
jgi:adenosylcobyric acid synthase